MKRTIRTLLTAVGALFITGVALLGSATAALAQHAPDTREGSGVASIAPQPASHSMAAAGSPLWTFIVVAMLTAIVSVLLTVLAVRRLDRPARSAHPLAA